MDFSNPIVQAALIAGVTAVIAGLVGGWVGGRAATNATRLNVDDAARARREGREEAQRVRHVEATRIAAARLLQMGQAHRIQLRDQVAWRSDQRNAPWHLAHMPRIERVCDGLAADELQVTAPSVASASLALQLMSDLVKLDEFAMESDPQVRIDPTAEVPPMPAEDLAAFVEADGAYLDRVVLFINQVRRDVGAEPWEPTTPAGDHR